LILPIQYTEKSSDLRSHQSMSVHTPLSAVYANCNRLVWVKRF